MTHITESSLKSRRVDGAMVKLKKKKQVAEIPPEPKHEEKSESNIQIAEALKAVTKSVELSEQKNNATIIAIAKSIENIKPDRKVRTTKVKVERIKEPVTGVMVIDSFTMTHTYEES